MRRSPRRSTSRNESSFVHIPVLASQVKKHLLTDPDAIYFDATVGTGGHSEIILSELSSRGMLIGIDKDKEAIGFAENRLKKFRGRFKFAQLSFSEIPRFFEKLKIKKVSGFLFDVGICSLQLNNPKRGFSYNVEGPVDMRMNQNQKLSAYEVVNHYSLKELIRIFKEYGQEKFSSSVARALVKKREKGKLKTTSQVRDIVESVVNPRYRIKSLSRIFQAIRIEVNRELDELKKGLDVGVKYLLPGGRLCFISYHSLEDRIVKTEFLKLSRSCVCPPDFPVCVCKAKAVLKIITPRPITPDKNEIEKNPRAKSAKLRVAVRTSEDLMEET
ncbi:MAG: 16S rRNA (cytosine(1402)-N(4))-methyltransferase RsmH [Candidatus Zixiibacteriota bacterium]